MQYDFHGLKEEYTLWWVKYLTRVLHIYLPAEADIPMGELPALYASAENVLRASLHSFRL